MKPSDTDDDLSPFTPEEEATMKAEIDLAMEPYLEITPAALIPVLRENLEHALRTHPYPRQLLHSFAPRKPVVVSGDGPVGGAQTSDDKTKGKDGA